jgi:hypothetical protein
MNITEKSHLDREDFVKWIETLSSFALGDLMKALDNGNLEAAQAHAERIKFIDLLAPWIGYRSTYPTIKIRCNDPE